MKKYIFPLVIVALTVLSCAKKEEPYQAAPAEVGNAFVFKAIDNPKVLIEDDTNKYDVSLLRTSTDGAATETTVSVNDTSGLFFKDKSIKISFNADSKDGVLSIPVNPSALEQGIDYYIGLKITDKASLYGIDSVSVFLNYPLPPEPWKSLGNALYREDFLSALFSVPNQEWEVEIIEKEDQPGFYRLINPYGASCPFNEEGDFDPDNDYNMDIHAEDPTAVYISTLISGTDWGYGSMVFASMAGLRIERGQMTLEQAKEAGLTGKLEDGVITFPKEALLFGMMDYNDGALYYANPKEMFRVVLPGTELADYSISIEYTGDYTNKDKDYFFVSDVTLGADVEKAYIVLVPELEPEEAIDYAKELIAAGDESVITVTESGEVKVPVTEITETYSVVAVSFGKEQLRLADADFIEFKDFSISVIASEPVLNDDEVTSTVEASFVFGEDVEYAKVAIFAKTAKEMSAEDLAIFDEEDNAAVVVVKGSDEIVPFILSEEGNYTIVAVSYAYEKSWNISTAELEFVLVNPWETVGSASWTESFVGPWFGLETVSYDVELQEHNETPGFYRLVNIYGAAFPYNEDGDWDASKDYYLKLHAEDANHVWFETFDTGCNWGYGNFLLASDMGLYIEQYGVDTVIAAVDAGQIPNTFGVKNGNVITFPIDAVLKAMAEYNGGGWYYGNHAAEWSITLNPAAPSSSPKKVSTRSLGSSEKYSARKSAVSIASGRVLGRTISKEAKIKAEL